MKVTDVQRHVTTLYRAGARHTLLLLGPPGIGKSEAVRNAAAELSTDQKQVEFRQWQATIEDPLELPGLPAVIDKKAVRVPFEDKIPTEGAGLLAIDEINSASSLTQCSLYSLVWDKHLGGAHLGKDWMIIATGNHDKDRGVTQRMPTPLVSRMEHIDVEPDHDGWMIKMAVDGAHDMVRAFIKTMPHLFVTFKPDVPGPFACPRTWKMVSDVMLAYGKNTPPFESIKGWVGDGPATEFMSYNMMAADLIDPDKIIADPKGAMVPESPGSLYALTTALAGKATYQNFTAIVTYLERMSIEFAVYCISQARDIERGRIVRMSPEEKAKSRKLQENVKFHEWCLRHHELIVT